MEKTNFSYHLCKHFTSLVWILELKLGVPWTTGEQVLGILKGPNFFTFLVYKFVKYVVFMYVKTQKLILSKTPYHL